MTFDADREYAKWDNELIDKIRIDVIEGLMFQFDAIESELKQMVRDEDERLNQDIQSIRDRVYECRLSLNNVDDKYLQIDQLGEWLNDDVSDLWNECRELQEFTESTSPKTLAADLLSELHGRLLDGESDHEIVQWVKQGLSSLANQPPTVSTVSELRTAVNGTLRMVVV